MTYVYAFDHKHRKAPMSMKDLLGGKGANLAEIGRASCRERVLLGV